MASPNAEASTSRTKKPHTKKEVATIHEETPRYKTSDLVKFPKACVPPRNPTTKKFRLHKELKYDLVTPVIPPRVIFEGDMLGVKGSLRFSDHDIVDLKMFVELAPHNYLCTLVSPNSLVLTVEMQEWGTRLQ
jgi:hypothetical protein